MLRILTKLFTSFNFFISSTVYIVKCLYHCEITEKDDHITAISQCLTFACFLRGVLRLSFPKTGCSTFLKEQPVFELRLILLMAHTPGRLMLLVSERFLGIDLLLLLPGVALI